MHRWNIYNNFINRCMLIRFSSNESVQIIIPKRIKRDNLSILKALASTVKKDYPSPNYKYFDDPYLIPKLTFEKRAYSLSKISGQDAAKYVNKEFPTSFEYDPSEPSIQSFLPSMGPQSADNTVEGLRERIFMLKSTLAHECYLKCIDENVQIPSDLVEDLLDLLCFYNSRDPPEEIIPEKLFFQHSLLEDKKQPTILLKTWNAEGSAERLFKNMPNPSSRAICSIIKGRAKYFDLERAFNEFIRAKENNIVIDDAETYNSVLFTVAFVAFDPNEKWDKIQNILNTMKSDGVFPTVHTFNQILGVVKTFRDSTMTQRMFSVLSEMKKCRIAPSLTTWTTVLRIVYHNRNVENDILYNIIEILSSQDLQILEPTDYDFFYTAMECILNNIKDLKLAYDLNNIVSNSSINLIGDGYRETLYYTNFFYILTTYENLEELMAVYNQLVPNTYDPTFRIMDSLFNVIEIQEGYTYMPKIYSDLVLMNKINNSDLLLRFLSILAAKKHDDQLQPVFAKIVENILNLYEEDAANIRLRKKFEINGQHLGQILIVFLNYDDFENAWRALEHYMSIRHKVNQFPSQKALTMLCEVCFRQNNAEKSLKLIKLMEDLGFSSADHFLKRVDKELTLNEEQLKLKQSIIQ